MSKKSGWLLPVALGLGAVVLIKGKNFASDLQTQALYKGIKIGLDGATLKLQIAISNPSKSKLTINSVSGNIYYQNKAVGIILSLQPAVINPAATSGLNLTVKITLRDLLTKFVSEPGIWQQLTAKYAMNTSAGRFTKEQKLSV